MKKLIALILLICIVAVAIYTCNDNNNDTSNLTSQQSSKTESGANITHSSLNSCNDFSDIDISSKTETDNSSFSSSNESDTENEITSIPDESDDDESTPESSLPEESEDETSSETSSEISSETAFDTPAHTCSFVKSKTIEPTCTKTGYTLYKCSCGKTEKRNYISALGHIEGEWIIIEEATATSTGLKQLTCGDCGEIIDEEVIPATSDIYNFPATAANAKLIEERVLYYINQYRNEEGVSSAQFLWDGKTYKYAKMRAEQIVDDFEHDREDIIEVCNELKFGYYCLNTEYVEGSGIVEPYYYGGCSEAITGPYPGDSRTVDYVAKYVADVIHASSGHWNYVGAETTKYISVGSYPVVLGEADWYFCIATTDSTKFD